MRRTAGFTRRNVLAAGASLLAAGLVPGIRRARAEEGAIERIVLVVIDGLRQSEWLGEDGESLAPRFAGLLRPEGRLFTNVRVTGETWTYPAHLALLTGTPQLMPRTKETAHHQPEMPTLFEALRAHRPELDATQVRLLAGKFFFQGLGASIHPSWGPSLGTRPNHGVTEGRWVDHVLWAEVDRVLSEDRPTLLVVNGGDVDEVAHVGDEEGYRDAITRADLYVHRLWQRLQWDPAYAGRTLLLVTTDHGRHLDGVAQGVMTHGDGCSGCRTAFLYAWGPGVEPGEDADPLDALAIAPTAAAILGADLPMAWGPVVTERLLAAEAVPAPQEPDWTGADGTDVSGEDIDSVTTFDAIALADGTVLTAMAVRAGERWGVRVNRFRTGGGSPVDLLTDLDGAAWPRLVADGAGGVTLLVDVHASDSWAWRALHSADEGVAWAAERPLVLTPSDGGSDPFNPWKGEGAQVDGRAALLLVTLSGFPVIATEPDSGNSWSCRYLGGGKGRLGWRDHAVIAHPTEADALLVLASRYRDMGRETGQSTWYGALPDVSGTGDLEEIDEWNTSVTKPVEVRTPRLASTPTGGVVAAWAQRGTSGDFEVWTGAAETPDVALTTEQMGEGSAPSIAHDDRGLHLVYLEHGAGTAQLMYRYRESGGSWTTATALTTAGELVDAPRVVAAAGVVTVLWRTWRDGAWRLSAVTL